MTLEGHNWYTEKGDILSKNKVYALMTYEVSESIKQFYNTLLEHYQGIHVTPKEIHGFYCSKNPNYKLSVTHLMKRLVSLGLPKSTIVNYKGKATRIYTIPKK